MLFVDEQGTDIEVQIIERIDTQMVKVRSLVGWPFGCNPKPGKVVQRCTKNEKIVAEAEIKVIGDG